MLELILVLHMSHTTCCHIFLINDERIGTVSVMTNQNAGKYSSCRNLFIEVMLFTNLFLYQTEYYF